MISLVEVGHIKRTEGSILVSGLNIELDAVV